VRAPTGTRPTPTTSPSGTSSSSAASSPAFTRRPPPPPPPAAQPRAGRAGQATRARGRWRE
jgi:hypothetical protein